MKATLAAIDQGNFAVPIDAMTLGDDGTLRIEMKTIGASFDGTLSADSSTITGEWHQGGSSLPVAFRRPGAPAAAFTLKPVTNGTIALQPCRVANDAIEALCGSYSVFENRRTRPGRTIALNVVIMPARSAAPEPDPYYSRSTT